jgi:putative restriction endonuclease
LRDADAAGQFSPGVRAAFEKDPALVPAVARTLLDAHFPPSAHENIASAVGLQLDAPAMGQSARDPAFRDAVLVAYGYACAVCRVGVRLGHAPVGVEAAHIRWHAAGGPDAVTNGLCLCSLHHALFDRGALTLSPDGTTVWVSERANGRHVERALGRYHGRRVARPARAESAPDQAHIAWHHAEVYQGKPPG